MSESWRRNGGGDTRWQKFRLVILARDGYKCTIRAKGCTTEAPIMGGHVDHIMPLSMGGQKYDPSNCRAACRHCNLTRAKLEVKYSPEHKSISTW